MWNKVIHMMESSLERFPAGRRLVRKRKLRQRFKTGLELIEGTHENPNKHPSIIHSSFHKAATQYVESILRRCAVENGMVPVGIHDYGFDTNFPVLHFLAAEEISAHFQGAGTFVHCFWGWNG
jgi:hypothetical protein